VIEITERDLAIAKEHPRGTERRTLLPYRDALNDVAAYARLAVADRDSIVRWVEIRRRLRDEHGVDHDPANLADPIIPYERLREHVLAGERAAAVTTTAGDTDGDLRDVVARIRGG
jgi:hypothetical protein